MTTSKELEVTGCVDREWLLGKLTPRASGCMEWSGTRTDRGYGVVRIRHRQWRAHRLAWTAFNGPIPNGLFVCHKCDNPPCCNPEHLFVGTPQDNVTDAVKKGRHAGWPRTKRKELCRRKLHDMEASGYRHSDGPRRCRECRNETRRIPANTKPKSISATARAVGSGGAVFGLNDVMAASGPRRIPWTRAGVLNAVCAMTRSGELRRVGKGRWVLASASPGPLLREGPITVRLRK